ncbi:hypothetical protein Ddc_23591 [Ditylenchus destructor]|nr:hypothetical protein Ddc_23591 [Ditylenchus destructor]
MPVYLAEDPLSELFSFLNRSSLDKLSLTNHQFNRIISSRFENAPFRVLDNVDIHCKEYRNKLDVNGIVAYIRRIFLKSCQIVRSRSSKDELNFLCKVVWDNRSITTSLNKVWNMITTEHTYARKLTLKIPTRRNGVGRNPDSDMRFQSATSIVPFKFTVQFHGYLEEEIVDYVNNYSRIINSKAAKMLNIEAEEASSQITVSVEEQEQEY